MKKISLSFCLLFLMLVSGFGSFFYIHRAIKIAEASTWLVPMLWVSLFSIFLCLSAIFVRQKMEVELVAVASFLLSLIFAFSPGHFLILIFAVFLILSALHDIRNDLDLNVKISLWKSLYAGKFKLIFAMSLIICSQYFFIVRNMNGQVRVPQFDLSVLSEKLVVPMLGLVNPNFAAAANENLTVDQFILQTQQSSFDSNEDAMNEQIIDSQIPTNISSQQRQMLKVQALEKISEAKTKLVQNNNELVLKEGRKQLSEMIGKPLNGNEKISLVFANLINDKIAGYFNPNIKGDSQSSLFPFILTLVLFLTIWPIGSLLSILWFLIIALIFRIFVKLEVVRIERIKVEREMIS